MRFDKITVYFGQVSGLAAGCGHPALPSGVEWRFLRVINYARIHSRKPMSLRGSAHTAVAISHTAIYKLIQMRFPRSKLCFCEDSGC